MEKGKVKEGVWGGGTLGEMEDGSAGSKGVDTGRGGWGGRAGQEWDMCEYPGNMHRRGGGMVGAEGN